MRTTTDETGSVYQRLGFWWGAGATINNFNGTNETFAYIGYLNNSSTQTNAGHVDIYNPNKATWTMTIGQTLSANAEFLNNTTRVETTTQYTGITFLTNSATTISGLVAVYGWRKA